MSIAITLSFRKSQILDIARGEGRVVVEDLAVRLGVTMQTIRRDLNDLSGAGKLDRVHGGAVMPTVAGNIRYSERRGINLPGKSAIAALCASRIPDNSSVLLNIGTSTEAVAHALVGHLNLTVLTNNLYVADILSANDSFRVIVAGGVLRPQDGGLVGDLTVEAFAQFKVDHAVIGTSAIDADGDLMDFDLEEVRVSRAIIRQAKRTFLVADYSKFTRSAPVRIASLAEVDVLFSDDCPPAIQAKCAEWGTEVAQPSLENPLN